jgi:hypothetical protein
VQDTSFPLFNQVQAEHVVPGVRALLKELHEAIDELEKNVQPTWQGLVEPLERIGDKHQRTWGIVSHLKVGSSTSCACALLPLPQESFTVWSSMASSHRSPIVAMCAQSASKAAGSGLQHEQAAGRPLATSSAVVLCCVCPRQHSS